MHKQHSFPALPVQTLRGDESSCQPPSQTFPDQETRYEAVRPSVLNGVPPHPSLRCRADREVPAWKTGQRWPNRVEPEAGSGALAEGWSTEAYRGLHRSFPPECRASVRARMNPMWKVYKSKVMKTLNPEYEEDAAEEVRDLQGFCCVEVLGKVDGGCWHRKSESQQIIFYSSRGRTSSLSCSVCCAERTLREKLGKLHFLLCVFFR